MTFDTTQTWAITAGAATGMAALQFIIPAASASFVLFFFFKRRKRRRRKARPIDYVIGGLLFAGFGAFFVFLSTLRT